VTRQLPEARDDDHMTDDGGFERFVIRVAPLVSTLVLAAVFVACGGGSSRSGSTPRTTANASTTSPPTTLPDVVPTAADFVNIYKMTRVGDHFFASLNGHLPEALAVARSATGGVYPVGTVIQLFPFEAMVKRHKGFNPTTNDWEFFEFDVSAKGTRIFSRGAAVVSRFGLGTCASCHRPAAKFDFVCGKSHCGPGFPFNEAQIAAIQRTDPRPKK
jgi:hypothetical protein